MKSKVVKHGGPYVALDSAIVRLILLPLCEIIVCILGQWAIFERVCVIVICRHRVDLHLHNFSADEVLESSCLLPLLAFIPI